MGDSVSSQAPALLPRYEVLHILGAGGGGEVWELRDRITDEHCAFKLLGSHAGQNETDALIREFLTLSSLEGLGLPRVIRFGRLPNGETPYVLRELIAGESLDKVLAQDPARALECLAQVCDQLTVLHRAGVFHGDLKPANIICRKDGPATLVDFGLATHSHNAGRPYGLTPRYAAPETFSGEPLTARAEVFSLGAVLRDISEQMTLDAFELQVIDAVAETIHRATSATPTERYPSADEFVAALRLAIRSRSNGDGTSGSLAWPILGIESLAAQILARVLALSEGQTLCLQGVGGSGRTVLLRKLAWSLGVGGQHLAYIDNDLRKDPRVFAAELQLIAAHKSAYILIDDATELSAGEQGRVEEFRQRGARLVTVGMCPGHATDCAFEIPPLQTVAATELLRRAVPSLTDNAVRRILEVSQGRPKALRQWVAKIADGTLSHLDVLQEKGAQSWSLGEPGVNMQSVRELLEHGRFKEAAPLLAQVAEHHDSAIETAIARAQLSLGIGEPRAALEALQPFVVPDPPPPAFAEEVWLNWARACLGLADYAGAVEAAGRVAESPTAWCASALIQRGLAECYLGEPDSARAAVVRALEIGETIDNRRVIATAHSALGFLAQRANELDDALAQYKLAIVAGEQCADASIVANAELNLGGLLKMRGDIAAAIDHFEAAVDGGARSGRRATVRHALLNLANLDLFLGRLARANSRLEMLMNAYGDLQPAQEAQRLGLTAELALRSGDSGTASTLFSDSAAAYRALGRHLDAQEAELESILAAVRVAQVDFSGLRARVEAVRHQLCEQSALTPLLWLADGRVSLAMGNETAARSALETAEKEARSCGHKDWLWRALDALADLEQCIGGLLRARQLRESALELLEDMASSLPRDLREVYWSDARRRRLRAAVAQAATPDASDTGGFSTGYSVQERTSGVSTWLSSPLDQRLVRILEITAELASDLRLDHVTDKIIEHAIRLSGAELGLVVLRDVDGQLSVQSSRTSVADDAQFQFSRSIAQTAISSGQPVVTLSAKDDQRMSGWASVHELMVQSVACLPIRAGASSTIGALYLETKHRRGNRFQSELPILQAFADQVAIALHSARLIKENQDRAAELQESNQKLSEAQQRLEEILGNKTQQLARTRRELKETRQTLFGHFGYHGLVGTSTAMRRVYAVIERVKSADVGVLITGESGTGKEMVARAIHTASDRCRGPFVGVNCGAIPENLLESELFGCVRGAFTGADRDRVGLFREANGGTLLLDEIGEMPSKMQAGLLRVLQSKTVRPVGGRREEPVDVRVLCATHRNLEELVSTGAFREDLYYRIHVVDLRIPALREHREDIPQLVNHFIGLFAAKFQRDRRSISREALRLLMAQPWRGNIRELEHVLLNAWIMSDADEIQAEDFELASDAHVPSARELGPEGSSDDPEQAPPSSRRLPSSQKRTAHHQGKALNANEEKRRILEALRACGYNKVKAAQMAGIPRRTFYRRLEAYGIK